VDEAARHLERAEQLFADLGDSNGLAHVRHFTAITVHHTHGDFAAAHASLLKAIEHYGAAANRERINRLQCVIAIMLFEMGREREAREMAEQARAEAERDGSCTTEGMCEWILGRCALLRSAAGSADRVAGNGRNAATDFAAGHGQAAAADRSAGNASADGPPRTLAAAHFRKGLEIGVRIEQTDLLMHCRLGLARIALSYGQADAAREHATAALARARATGPRFPEALALVTLGECDHGNPAPGASRPPATAWKKAERILRAIGARWELHRLLLLRLRAGDVEPSRVPDVLRELIGGVIARGHEALFTVHERAVGAAVLFDALRRDIHRAYAIDTLAALGDEAVPVIQTGLREPSRRPPKQPRGRRLRDRPEPPAVTPLPLICANLLARIGTPGARAALARCMDPSTEIGRIAHQLCRQSRQLAIPMQIYALGPLTITIGTRVLTNDSWTSTRASTAFAFLLRKRFHWVHRDILRDAIWPSGTGGTRHNLSQTLHLLRKTLEPELVEGVPSAYLQSRRLDLRLNPGTGFTYDVIQLEKGIRRARMAIDAMRGNGRPNPVGLADRSSVISLLQHTLSLYKGDFLAELPFDETLKEEREALRELWRQGMRILLELLMKERRLADLIAHARTAVLRDPYHETFQEILIQAQVEAGRSAEARESYKHLEKLLIREYGTYPSTSLRKLVQRKAR
jgi:DNA-binding SARP family transcriptional activator